MIENEKNVPKRRFKEFKNAEAWEQRKIGELCDEFKSGDTIKSDDIVELGAFPVYGGNGFRGYTNSYNHDGDYALIGRQGALCGNMKYVSGKAYFTEHAIAVKSNEKNVTGFLFHLFSTMNLGQYSGQSAQPGLAVNKLIELVSIVPNKVEQTRIYSFFKHLDNLITLHQRKLDKIKALKKAYLTDMFPAEGEHKPKLRFAGFTGEWEQRKLGKITNSYSGGTPSVGVKAYYNGDIPFIRSAEINSAFTELFITENGLNSSSARIVNEGDILYALYGATSGEVGIAKLTGAINQAILAIQPMTKYDAEYLMQWLRKSKQNIVDAFIQGGQGNLSGAIIKNLIIDLPQYEEQSQIGIFLNNLDTLITRHQRKLEKLQNIKKAYLNEMFI